MLVGDVGGGEAASHPITGAPFTFTQTPAGCPAAAGTAQRTVAAATAIAHGSFTELALPKPTTNDAQNRAKSLERGVRSDGAPSDKFR